MMDIKKQSEEKDECRKKKKGNGPIMISETLVCLSACMPILYLYVCVYACNPLNISKVLLIFEISK